jgi:putative membrane protein
MNILARWVINALVISVAAYILPGVHVLNFYAALAAALVLGVINITIRPVLLILTLPVTVLSLGIFTFIINALMILLSAKIVPGFIIDNFWWAIIFSIILSLINYFLYQMFE